MGIVYRHEKCRVCGQRDPRTRWTCAGCKAAERAARRAKGERRACGIVVAPPPADWSWWLDLLTERAANGEPLFQGDER